jgi:hypothetical protein
MILHHRHVFSSWGRIGFTILKACSITGLRSVTVAIALAFSATFVIRKGDETMGVETIIELMAAVAIIVACGKYVFVR